MLCENVALVISSVAENNSHFKVHENEIAVVVDADILRLDVPVNDFRRLHLPQHLEHLREVDDDC